MGGLDKVEKILLVALVVLWGLLIYASWYVVTHPGYGMKTVKTGDVTWVCLTEHGTTIGCDTVEEYK